MPHKQMLVGLARKVHAIGGQSGASGSTGSTGRGWVPV